MGRQNHFFVINRFEIIYALSAVTAQKSEYKIVFDGNPEEKIINCVTDYYEVAYRFVFDSYTANILSNQTRFLLYLLRYIILKKKFFYSFIL